MKVIARDNYDRDYVDDFLVAGPGLSHDEATTLAESENAKVGERSPWFYAAVSDDYEMKHWEP